MFFTKPICKAVPKGAGATGGWNRRLRRQRQSLKGQSLKGQSLDANHRRRGVGVVDPALWATARRGFHSVPRPEGGAFRLVWFRVVRKEPPPGPPLMAAYLPAHLLMMWLMLMCLPETALLFSFFCCSATSLQRRRVITHGALCKGGCDVTGCPFIRQLPRKLHPRIVAAIRRVIPRCQIKRNLGG